jgi:adenylate kinase family enzyme
VPEIQKTTLHKSLLANLFWLAGAVDSGKTTVARILADRFNLAAYHYDKHDLCHHQILAQTMPDYRRRLDASQDENWVHPDPE